MNYQKRLPDDEIIFSSPEDADRPGEPNYERKLRHLTKKGVLPVGHVRLINIAHDDWCAIYGGACCDCNPDIICQITGKKLG